ncbi:MAG: acyl-CoA thioester hydrolase YciA [Succinivibrio sp.]
MEKKSENRNHPPVGNLLLRTLAMPGDTNPAGDIFGGWIMSQMDIAGAILAREIANGRVVTAAVEGMSFLKPVSVGDVVCCYGKCIRVGVTSMSIHLEIWVKKLIESETNEHAERHLVTEANFTYVAIDKNKRPRHLPPSAKLVAEKGIDAACVGLNVDGSIR